MPYFLFTFFLAFTITMNALAQPPVEVSINFLPNTAYQITSDAESLISVKVRSDEMTEKELIEKGISTRKSRFNTSKLEISYKVGSTTNTGEVPIVITCETELLTKKPDKEQEATKHGQYHGAVGYGHVIDKKEIKLDSATSPTNKHTLKDYFLSSMNRVIGDYSFFDKPLNIGDTISNLDYLYIPLSGMLHVPALINAEYKLVKIDADKAFFDIIYRISVNDAMVEGEVTVGGTGTGQMVYSIDKGFVEQAITDYEVKFSIVKRGLKGEGIARVKSNRQASITANL